MARIPITDTKNIFPFEESIYWAPYANRLINGVRFSTYLDNGLDYKGKKIIKSDIKYITKLNYSSTRLRIILNNKEEIKAVRFIDRVMCIEDEAEAEKIILKYNKKMKLIGSLDQVIKKEDIK